MLKSMKSLKVLLPLAFCVASLNLPAFAQEAKLSRVLTVTGSGDRMVQTTKAQIQLGVVSEAKTAQEAQAAIASKTSAIVSKLQELKVEQLQTTSITLNPKYEYVNNRQNQVGFTGQSSVSFRIPLQQAGKTLDLAVAVGANRIDAISFVAPDEEIRAARNASLQDAVKDAQSQADAILSVLNLKAQSIRTIQVNSAAAPVNNVNYNLAAKVTDSTPVIGGEQKVQTFVTLEINY
jgi:uncharacterized protein